MNATASLSATDTAVILSFTYSPETLRLMREWVYDCGKTRLACAPDSEVVRWVHSNFAGGVPAFLETL